MKYIGIDLGTTYSCIATLDDFDGAQPRALDVKGRNTTPSVVWFPDGKPVVVGDNAKRHLGPDAKSTVAFAKREMVVDENNDVVKRWNINGAEYNPVDISGMILKYLYDAFLDTSKEEHKVVITCPANYNLAQRELVRAAAVKAGINTEDSKTFRIINEPTAAAISYVMESPERRGNIVVFDLGGGTLDVTALFFDKDAKQSAKSADGSSDSSSIPRINVIDSQGLPYLGGADWDKVVQEEIVRQLGENGVTDITDKMRDSMITMSEQAKIDLTDSDLELYGMSIGNEDLEFNYTQSQFEADTEHLLKNALDQIEVVINNFDSRRALIGEDIPADILGIVLVGGSSHMPQVKKGIEARFPQFVGKIMISDPSQAIARGAAYYCKMMGSDEGAGPTDLMPMTIGTDVSVNREPFCFNMIYWKDPIPCKKEFHFTLPGNNPRVSNKIFTNSCKNPGANAPPTAHYCSIEECKILGEFDVVLSTPGSPGDDVLVIIEVDIGGIMTCHAECNGEVGDARLELKGGVGKILASQ